MGGLNYILKNGIPVPEPDLMTWARSFEKTDRVIEQTMIGDVKVSTVFLGLDHQFGSGPPLLFETMIFGGDHDQDQWRYATLGQAKTKHFRIVDAIKEGANPNDA